MKGDGHTRHQCPWCDKDRKIKSISETDMKNTSDHGQTDLETHLSKQTKAQKGWRMRVKTMETRQGWRMRVTSMETHATMRGHDCKMTGQIAGSTTGGTHLKKASLPTVQRRSQWYLIHITKGVSASVPGKKIKKIKKIPVNLVKKSVEEHRKK